MKILFRRHHVQFGHVRCRLVNFIFLKANIVGFDQTALIWVCTVRQCLVKRMLGIYGLTDACLTADPGVASSIPARYHTFVEIDHEIISTVILLPSADLFKKGCCQLQAKVCAQITG